MSKIIFIKILLSIGIGLAFIYPLISETKMGVLAEIKILGLFWSSIVVCLFFIAIIFYAKLLQNTLNMIDKEARKLNPKSVWLMLVIPYNFIEDFFIIYHVSESIKNQSFRDSRLNKLKNFGTISGFGWCTAQIISLIPNNIGAIAGLIALIFWIIHWRFIVNINTQLAQKM